MQYIQDACLINLVVNSIFKNNNYNTLPFTWEKIGRHSTIFSKDYDYYDAQVLLQLSLMVTNSNFDNLPLNPPDWLQSHELKYIECPSDIISRGVPNSIHNTGSTLGYVLYSDRANILFVIFTGTSNVCMASIDFDYKQTEFSTLFHYTPGLKGHNGIYNAYKSINKQLYEILDKYKEKTPQIIITGHSLGGGLSQICALDLSHLGPIHYSFAAPLIFNNVGCQTFNNLVKHSYRIANISDLVTVIPLPVMNDNNIFCHVGNLISFQKNLESFVLNHSLAYVQEFDIL